MSVETISAAQCRTHLDAGRSLQILDVRTPPEFNRVHARGATLMPLDRLDCEAIRAQRNGSSDPLYVICQSGSRAASACKRLMEANISNVVCIEGGTAAWVKAGLPVEGGGSKTMSLERQVRIAAGSLVLVGLILAHFASPWFLGLSAFVGAGLVFAGVTDYCGMGLLLAKMPWNR